MIVKRMYKKAYNGGLQTKLITTWSLFGLVPIYIIIVETP